MLRAIVVLLFLLPLPAAAQEFLAARIAAENPCKGLELRQTLFGADVSLGLTELTALEIRRAGLRLEGGLARLDLDGSIACRTGAGSLLQGDAALDLGIAAEVTLADCVVSSLTLTPAGYGGSLGDLLAAAWPDLIGPALESEARRLLSSACRDATGTPP